MALFAIKSLPLNLSPMNLRPELGEIEIDTDTLEKARDVAQSRVPSDKPHDLPVARNHQVLHRATANSSSRQRFTATTAKISMFIKANA